MVKRIAAAAAAVFMSACLFAYNPPAGGEYLFGISSPFQLTSAQSSAGGAFFDVTPASQVFNPALQAFEQRQRGGVYRIEEQHRKVSSFTFPRQAAKASVTGSSVRICCASAIMTGMV